jgi:origin recognition complex subunit 1
MAPVKQKKTKLEKARQYLKTGGVYREDSDDELGTDDYPWEWIYEDSKGTVSKGTPSKRGQETIIGARMGKFECFLGDCVLLKAEGNEAWVGIIHMFFHDEESGQKMCNLMWFSSPWEIRNKLKARPEAHEVSPVRMNDARSF